MPTPIHIRIATEADVPAIHGLIVELAVYQREPDAVLITEADLVRDGWGTHPHFTCLVAEADGAVCGFALYHPTYSTWQGRSLYLEDLYVQPAHRARGVGTALLARVAAEALAAGSARLDWSVLTWNEQALRVYERIGAVRMDDWVRMRVAGTALAELAARAEAATVPADPASPLPVPPAASGPAADSATAAAHNIESAGTFAVTTGKKVAR